MSCPYCGRRISIRNTYVTDAGKTQRAVCEPCDVTYTLLTLLVCETKEEGDGAYALARRLEREGAPKLNF